MSGTFGSLSTALSSLYAQRRGLEVSGQNIANVNTDGYSRQRLELTAVGAPIMPAMYAKGDAAGGGVAVHNLTRLRDEFLESRARAETSTSAYLNNQKQVYDQIEALVNEPSDTGIQSQLTEFWAAWQDVNNNSGSEASRTQLLERSKTLADSLKSQYNGASSLWDSTREQASALVTEINNVAATVAQLNEAVIRTHQVGLPGNEIADERDKAVLRLSELTGSLAVPKEDGSVDVMLNGSSLVSGAMSRKLQLVGADRLADVGTTPVSLTWVDNGNPASVPLGQITSTFETLNSILPNMTKALDGVVAKLVDDVNTQHKAGFDLSGTAGVDFFTGTTAATIAVAFTDPKLVAASADAAKALDGSNADAIAAIGKSTSGADRLYRQFVVDIGVSAQTVNRRTDIQNAITSDVDQARLGTSAVNLDEEMSNLIMYQRAYEAAAKVMTTISDSIAGLMNMVGR